MSRTQIHRFSSTQRPRRTTSFSAFATLAIGLGMCALAACSDDGSTSTGTTSATTGTETSSSTGTGGGEGGQGQGGQGEGGQGGGTPVVPPPAPIVDVAAALMQTCAVLDNGEVHCWGRHLEDGYESAAPRRVEGADGAVAVAVGPRHACTLRSDGKVVCWGGNQFGQLGRGVVRGVLFKPEVVPGIDNAVEVRVSLDETCARLATGRLMCWGVREFGGSIESSVNDPSPTLVEGLENVVHFSMAGHHRCATTQEKRTYCWGSNLRGQLGIGSTEPMVVPTEVLDGDFAQTGALLWTTLGRRPNGQVAGWGEFYGSTTPLDDPELTGIRSIGAGGHFHVCFITNSYDVACFGDNKYGQTGNGVAYNGPNQSPINLELTVVPGMSDAVALAVGTEHSCVLRADGHVYCWGNNQAGALGAITATSTALAPVRVQWPAPTN